MEAAALLCIALGRIVQDIYPALGLGGFNTYCPGEHVDRYDPHEAVLRFFSNFNKSVRRKDSPIERFRNQRLINLRLSQSLCDMFKCLPDPTPGIISSTDMIISSIKKFKYPINRSLHSHNTKLETNILNAVIMFLVLDGNPIDLIRQLEQITHIKACNRSIVQYQIKRLIKLFNGENQSYRVCAHYEQLYEVVDMYIIARRINLRRPIKDTEHLEMVIAKLDDCHEPEFAPIYKACQDMLRDDMAYPELWACSHDIIDLREQIPTFDVVYESY